MVFIVLSNTACSKISDGYDPIRRQSQCRDVAKEQLASVAITLGLDSSVVLAPIPIIWKLQMSLKKKLTVWHVWHRVEVRTTLVDRDRVS